MGAESASRRPAYLLAVLTIVWFLAYLDRKIIALLVVDLKRDLRLDDVQASLLQGVAFAVLFVVAGLPIGRLVDGHNRRNIVIAGVLLWSAATILCGFATSFATLFAARMFVGLGEACLAPAAASMIADSFATERRGRAMGTMLMGGAVGTAASAFMAGAVLSRFPHGAGPFADWQLTFVVAGATGLLVAPLLLLIAEPTRVARVDDASAQPGILAVLRDHWRLLAPLYIGFVANMVASFGTSAWIPAMLMRDYHMTAARVGAILGTLLLAMGVFAPIVGGWASDLAARRNAANGRLRLAVMLFAVQALVGGALLSRDFTATLVGLAINALTSSALAASAMVVLQESGPRQVRGQSIAIYLVATNVIGMGLGPLFVALLTDHLFGSEAMVRESVALTLAITGAVGFAMMLIALATNLRARSATGRMRAA